MVAQACNPSTQEEEAGESGVPGYFQLHSKFEASLGYKTTCLKNKSISAG